MDELQQATMTPSSQQSTTTSTIENQLTSYHKPELYRNMNPIRENIRIADVPCAEAPCANPRCVTNGGIASSTHKCPDCGMNIHATCGKEMVNLAFVLCPLCERKRNNPQQVPTAAATTAVPVSVPVPVAVAAASASASASASAKKDRAAKIEQMAKFFEDNYKDADTSIEIATSRGQETPCGGSRETSRLISICGVEVRKIDTMALQKFCRIAGLKEWTRKSKKEICDLIVKFKEDRPKALEATAGPRQNKTTITGSSNEKANGMIRIINCLFHPTIIGLYATYGGGLNKDEMTAGKKKNQTLQEKVYELFQSDDPVDDDDTEDFNIAAIHHEFPGSDGLSASKNDCGTLNSWETLACVLKKLHTDFNTVLRDWKKSGEHRDFEDVLEGLHKDLEDEDNPWKINKVEVLYYFHFMKDHPEILPTISKSLPSGVKRATTDLKTPSRNTRVARGKSSKSSSEDDLVLKNLQDTLAGVAGGLQRSKSHMISVEIGRLEKSNAAMTFQQTLCSKTKDKLRSEIKAMPRPSSDSTNNSRPTIPMSQNSESSLFSLSSTRSQKIEEFKTVARRLKGIGSALMEDEERLKILRVQLREALRAEEKEQRKQVAVRKRASTAKNPIPVNSDSSDSSDSGDSGVARDGRRRGKRNKKSRSNVGTEGFKTTGESD